MQTTHSTFSSIAGATLVALALQFSACAFDVRDAPEDAADRTDSSVHESAGYHHHPMTYVASGVASIVYLPAKLLFAVGGGAVSAISYIVTLGSSYPATSIWNASVDGDYLVTPLMIEGGDDVSFVGP